MTTVLFHCVAIAGDNVVDDDVQMGEVKLAGLRGLSTMAILLALAGVWSFTAVGADAESGPLDSGRLIDDLDDDSEGLLEEVKRAAFRSDLGKRDDEDAGEVRDTRARSRSRSFKTDLGKRRAMFRSDLGRRSAWPWETAADRAASARLRDMERRRAMFRSDLGKRSYERRMFRTDLGKRQMFRHDLG